MKTYNKSLLMVFGLMVSVSSFADTEKVLTESETQILYSAMQAADPALQQENGAYVSGLISCTTMGQACCTFSPKEEEMDGSAIGFGGAASDDFFGSSGNPRACGPEAYALANLIPGLAGNLYDAVQINSARCSVDQCTVLIAD